MRFLMRFVLRLFGGGRRPADRMAWDWLREAKRLRRRWDRDYDCWKRLARREEVARRRADMAAEALVDDWGENEALVEQQEHVVRALQSSLSIAEDVTIPRQQAESEAALQRWLAEIAGSARKQAVRKEIGGG